jgi:acylphosphatase
MTCRQLLYSGRVQGVGFRAGIKSLAKGYEVTGWVQNLPDGRVEMQVMTTEEDEMDAFLLAIEESELAGLIKETEIHFAPDLTGVRGFSIVR